MIDVHITLLQCEVTQGYAFAVVTYIASVLAALSLFFQLQHKFLAINFDSHIVSILTSSTRRFSSVTWIKTLFDGACKIVNTHVNKSRIHIVKFCPLKSILILNSRLCCGLPICCFSKLLYNLRNSSQFGLGLTERNMQIMPHSTDTPIIHAFIIPFYNVPVDLAC
jgi:hypothetical protein